MIARKTRILIIILITIAVLSILLGIGYAILSLTTDVFKSDKELFYKYISKNEDIIDVIDKNYINSYKDKIDNNMYDNSGKLAFRIESDIEKESQLTTAMNNVKLNFEGNVDRKNEKIYQDIKLTYSAENKELFNVKFLKENDLYGLKTDEIVTKYVSVENNNIHELYNRLGLENTNNIANKIEEYDFTRNTKYA